jgi:hypothetical protein
MYNNNIFSTKYNMKYYLIIGILLLIFGFSLALDVFLNRDTNKIIEEEFQAFSKSQVIDLSQCLQGVEETDKSCKYFKYYDTSSNLIPGYFRIIPFNFYVDNNKVLQPVPYGYVANEAKNGYIMRSTDTVYSETQKQIQMLVDNAITTPNICNPNDTDYNDGTKCFNTQYVIMENNAPKKVYDKIRIPEGYYVDKTTETKGLLKKVPFGYTINASKYGITMNSDFASSISNTKYNTNNYNVIYNEYPISSEDESSAGPGKMWVLNSSGELIALPYEDVSRNTLYYEPGSFRFGSSNYVPNYEETVYLSKLTNLTTTTPYVDASTMGGGFCDYYKNNPDKLEEMCNDTSANSCASTSCCVLLGGQKCVYGDAQGPYMKSNYSNFLVTNPEFYYYQGKCYGKCM